MKRILLGCLLLCGGPLIADAWGAGYPPTAFEQLQLEWINRARANPEAEVARLNIPSLNHGISFPQFYVIQPGPKPPLAFNENVIKAARDYTQTLLDNNTYGHDYNGTTPSTRVEAAGYSLSPQPAGAGENLTYDRINPPYEINAARAQNDYENFFLSGDHRYNLLAPFYREAGVGMGFKLQFHTVGPTIFTTQNFTYRAGNSFLTGVAYNDDVTGDSFYTPGEGIGNVTITATPIVGGAAQSTTTWASGGYSLQLPNGTYNVTASAPWRVNPIALGQAVINSQNVKRDAVNPPGIPTLVGDYNKDGKVDTADYVVWRNGQGTIYNAAGFDFWKTSFGQASAAGSLVESVDVQVPEPGVGALVALGACVLSARRWRRSPAFR
jgi:hypothetical protein